MGEAVDFSLSSGVDADRATADATAGVDYDNVNYYVADGSGGYRIATDADLRIAAGDTEVKVYVRVKDDSESEADETLALTANTGSDKVAGDKTVSATGVISDDRSPSNPDVDEDTTATLSIVGGDEVREGDDAYLEFTVNCPTKWAKRWTSA